MPDQVWLSPELAPYATLPPEECLARFTCLSPHERLALLAAGADALAAALAGLGEADLDRSVAPGAWTIRQIVHHLTDGETFWSVFLRLALGVPGASAQLDWYPGNETWAGALDYAGRPIEAAVALFRAQRLYTAHLLEHMGQRWEQCALVGGRPMRVVDIACLLTVHAAEHVAEICKIREQGGG
jgi:hypothetical protein